MTCDSCGYGFVFDPKQPPGLTDAHFAAILRKISANGSRYFTENGARASFAVELAAKNRQSGCFTLGVALFITLFAGTMGVVILETPAVFAAALVLGLLLAFALRSDPKPRLPSASEFGLWLHRWQAQHGPIQGLIREPSLAKPEDDNAALRDLESYGVERILIVDDEPLVDVLVRNGWAHEQRCLVLASSGYPEHIRLLAFRFLQERPELPVYLLHGAERFDMLEDLQDAGFPLRDENVVDMGLSPEQVSQNPWFRRNMPSLPPEQARPDFLPPSVMQRAVTEAVVAGLVLTAALLVINPTSNTPSDFG